MTAKQIVYAGLGYARMSARDLAAKLGCSPASLNNRLDTGKFSVEEWEKIAKAMGAELKLGFKFPDGREI